MYDLNVRMPDDYESPRVRLCRYLSCGGLRAFAGTWRLRAENRRLNRRLLGAGVFGVLWLVFWLF